MMKSRFKVITALLSVVLLLSAFASCGKKGGEGTDTREPTPVEEKDYVAELKLNMNSETLKQVVTVHTYVDGDTTHFNVPSSVVPGGILKARYLAVNTPESTGKIEEWGKKASNFTKEKLSSATSILIESDDGKWNVDSTSSRRILVWVWYKPSEDADYRNLNVEILQNGLAVASNSANNRYGSTCVAAIAQASAQKLYVHSGEKDPDFYYGDAKELTLKELRCNVADYNGVKVAFEGIVTKNFNNTAYVEAYDDETGLYYGMTVYYGFNLNGDGLKALNVGNLTRVVGTVQFYETGGTWQVSGLTYRQLKPNDPNNVQMISSGHEASYKLTDAKTLLTGKVSVDLPGEEDSVVTKEFSYGELALSTSVRMENLRVTGLYTTNNPESSSNGAISITCTAEDGTEITVRTEVLRDAGGNIVKQDAFEGKTINVRGLVDYFNGSYQVKVFALGDITIQ